MSKKKYVSDPAWGSVPDWCIVALGVIMFFVGVFVNNITAENYTYASMWMWWSIILGILMVLAGLWDMASPGLAPVWAEGILSFLVFLLPWFTLGAGLQGSHWIAWAVGVLGCICTIWAWASQSTSER